MDMLKQEIRMLMKRVALKIEISPRLP